jgi:hypothetical protein
MTSTLTPSRASALVSSQTTTESPPMPDSLNGGYRYHGTSSLFPLLLLLLLLPSLTVNMRRFDDDKGLGGFDLLLSPHPDDLVYSAYAALSDRARPKVGVVFFNVSKFARGRLLPTIPVTAFRTLEDRLILGRNGVKTSYLFLRDSTTRDDGNHELARWPLAPGPSAVSLPQRIFAPLGVGGHEDHLLVRRAAISWWSAGYGRIPQVCFYEDLPYAAKSRNLEEEEKRITDELEAECGALRAEHWRLEPSLLRRKLLFSRLYLSQADKAELFLRHAVRVGRVSDDGPAERYFCTVRSSP